MARTGGVLRRDSRDGIPARTPRAARAPRAVRLLGAAGIALGLVVSCLAFGFPSPGGSAGVAAASATSGTYSIDLDGFFYRTQDAFLPTLTLTDLGLRNPSDLCALEDRLYIADTGNQRVVVYDIVRDRVTVLTHEGMGFPTGVHAALDGRLYVADPKAEAVFLFDADLSFLRDYRRPTDPAYGPGMPFKPYRVGSDRRGSLYIVAEGFGDGIIQLDNNGGFLGFFTSNRTSIGLIERLQDLFFTEEIKEMLFPRLPPIFSSLAVDEATGLVYSTSFNSPGSAVKKHNIAGRNMLGTVVDVRDEPVDVAVDDGGTIYVGYQRGTIAVFSDEGRLLFRFGADSAGVDISGLFTKLSALTADSRGNLWVLDGDKSFLQRFTPTDYALSIHQAIDLYNRGDYAASMAAWKAVLSKNEMSVLAHAGIAQVHLLRQEYGEAAREFAIAGDRTAYSLAFWEVRNAYLQRHAGTWIALLLGFVLLLAAFRTLARRRGPLSPRARAGAFLGRFRFFRDLAYIRHVLFHPADAFYEIRLRHHGSRTVAAVLVAAAFGVYLYDMVGKGFVFRNRRVEDENLALMAGAFFLLLGLFVVGNTLVASINEGNGKFLDVLTMTGYALAPAVLLLPLSTLLSGILTENERILFTLIRVAAFGWTFVTLSVGVAETHEYLYRNALKSLLLTAFFMVLSILSLSVLAILGSRLADFLLSIVKEVATRG